MSDTLAGEWRALRVEADRATARVSVSEQVQSQSGEPGRVDGEWLFVRRKRQALDHGPADPTAAPMGS